MKGENQTLAELLREVIAEDRSLLGRRDELLNKLDDKVTGAQQRYYQALKRAIQDFNVAETMLLAYEGSDEDRDSAKKAALRVQLEANIQEKRARDVVDTLAEAMGWNENTIVDKQNSDNNELSDVSMEAIEPLQQPVIYDNDMTDDSEDILADWPLFSSEVDDNEETTEKSPLNVLWDCSCGKSNNGNFCTRCGAPKKEVKTVGHWVCGTCGKSNNGNFCTKCGGQKPDVLEGWLCSSCGKENKGNFCTRCGTQKT